MATVQTAISLSLAADHGIVDAGLGQRRIDLAEDAPLTRRAPRLGDGGEPLVRAGLESRQGRHEALGREHEHAAVPSEGAGVEIPLSGLGVRLLNESLGDVCTEEAGDGLAALDVAVRRRRARGHDRERDEAVAVILDELEAKLEPAPELVQRLDDVVGGQHDKDRLGVAFGQHRRRQAHGVDGVAPDGLPEDLLVRKVRQRAADRVAVGFGGADEPVLGRNDTFHAAHR
jgi:hypothetical protein